MAATQSRGKASAPVAADSAPAPAPASTTAKHTAKDAAKDAGTTLFVSRLPYEATSTDLETFFSAIGPIRRAFVVTDPVTRFSKGVGYVNFALNEDAQTALATLQGAKLQGGAKKAKAIRIEVAKQRDSLKDRKRKRTDPTQPQQDAAAEPKEEEGTKRVKTANHTVTEEQDDDDEEEEADEPAAESDIEVDDDDNEGSDDDDEEEEDDDEEDDDDEEEEAPKQRPALPTPSEGTTLFIRNLSYTTSEPEFRALFARFGALRYAKITMDHSTGRSRGTGFVCFWNKDDAERVLEAARRVNGAAGTGANADPLPTRGGRVNPFSLAAASAGSGSGSKEAALLPQGVQSVLTADPSAPLASTLTLHGRLLSILPAVERITAEKIGSAALRERQKADKRNTYLMREGVPLPSASLAGTCLSTLSEKDKERRLDEFGRRKSQLERNPSLFVSKTRLSIRQLPLFATSKVLKRLAITAVRSFKKEVKDGSRPDLDEDERSDPTISPALALAQTADDGAPNRKARKQAERPTAVIQAKVVRQTDRIDPVTGEGRSRGYGFLEMASFQDALRVLRWANGRKEVGELMREYWADELERSLLVLKKDAKAGKPEAEVDPTAADASEGGDRATRIARMEKKVKELKMGVVDKAERGGGTVAVEFSVENAVVTKKRRDRVTGPRVPGAGRGDDGEGGRGGFREGGRDSKDGKGGRNRFERGGAGERDGKPERGGGPAQRRENWNKKTPKSGGKDNKAAEGANRKAVDSIKGKEKSDKVLGSVIGKKRKERREKKGGGGR